MTTPENNDDRIMADRTGEQLVGLLLPTILEVADLPGLTVQKVRDDLKVLEKMRIVKRETLGWFRPDKSIILMDKGLDRYPASEVQRTWLGPAGLRNPWCALTSTSSRLSRTSCGSLIQASDGR